MTNPLSWLGKLRPTGPRKEFSVVWWDNKGVEHYEHKDVSQQTALGTAHSLSGGLVTSGKIAARIVVKDRSGSTTWWEWKDSKVVYDIVPIARL